MILYMVNLLKVRRPSRYINNEINAIYKGASADGVRVALAFPDVYDVGMSHLGLRILYDIINSIPHASAERVFHPWLDYEEAMRAEGLPLMSLETSTPVDKFDVLGFSLQYELSYTSVLNMLHLGRIPLRSEDRDDSHPLVIAGGPCTVNPMPMSPFMDAFLVGDAEEAIGEIVDVVHAHKTGGGGGGGRDALLKALSGVEGVYVPLVHNATGASVTRRFVDSLDDAPYPLAPVVPYTQIVHDRVNIEVARGCSMGCRFCQAGIIYRPLRERSPETVLRIAGEALGRTGYEEVSFSSLSTGDYSALPELLKGFNDRFRGGKVSISLPSLRVRSVNEKILKEIVSVRKTGFTIAPEAATERLRSCMNKDFMEEDYERSLESLFRAGWLNLKLYFMIGLPTERGEDIEAIPPMVMKALRTAKRHTGRFVNISVSVSPFTPKAHTPFQWEGQADIGYMREKKAYLRERLRKINFRGHEEETSMLEAVFARGDAGLADLVEAAFKEGARLDAWSEAFQYTKWQRAMERTGIDAEHYARRTFGREEPLPWDFIQTGIEKEFLLKEHGLAMEAGVTGDCREECLECGLQCPPVEAPVPLRPHAPPPATPHRKPIRVRARFSKTGPMRYLSHRELMTHMTRALRRTGVRFQHTQGFHPTPKLALGPPLGVGIQGLNEYFDMEIIPLDPLDLTRQRLNASLGPGVEVHELLAVGVEEPSLQSFVTSYLYEISCPDAGEVRRFLELERATVQRKNGEVDIRPMLKEAEVLSATKARLLLTDLREGNVRLDEIALAVFGTEVVELDIIRLSMFGPKGRPVPPFQEAAVR
jgi:radical SAM family uncharacterized protein/radical SAM-linked protein